MLPDNKSIPTVMTVIGKDAKGSIIHKQLQDFTAPTSLVPASKNSTFTNTTTKEVILQSPRQLTNQGQGRLNDEGYWPVCTNHTLYHYQKFQYVIKALYL